MSFLKSCSIMIVEELVLKFLCQHSGNYSALYTKALICRVCDVTHTLSSERVDLLMSTHLAYRYLNIFLRYITCTFLSSVYRCVHFFVIFIV